jgi:uncharacterized protein with ACT and thioredoxin-like domain
MKKKNIHFGHRDISEHGRRSLLYIMEIIVCQNNKWFCRLNSKNLVSEKTLGIRIKTCLKKLSLKENIQDVFALLKNDKHYTLSIN